MFNKVFLIGNLGRDPKMAKTESGQAVANLSVATNRAWKDREGERREETEWHDVVCFGRQAEVAQQYLVRGRQIHVEGRLKTRSWTDEKTGVEHRRTAVVCEHFQMLGSPRNVGSAEAAPEAMAAAGG